MAVATAALLFTGCAPQSELGAKLPQVEARAPAPPPWPAQAFAPPAFTPCAVPAAQPLPPPAQASLLPAAPPSVTVAPEPPLPPPPPPPAAIIHQADMHGMVKARSNNLLTIEPLVVTSSTLPAKGNKGELFVKLDQPIGGTEWLLVAEVDVAMNLTPGTDVGLNIVKESEEALVEGGKVGLLLPGSTVRLRWEW